MAGSRFEPDRDRMIGLCRQLCSYASPLGEEGPLGEHLAAELTHLGFEVELQTVVPNRYNVIAIARGDSDYRSILLNGHLDMPMPAGRWRHDPFDPWIEGDTLYGAGLHDMKGGLAALVTGAATYIEQVGEKRGDVIISAVMNHDTTGLGTKYFLETSPWTIDAGINAEPTDLAVQLFHGGAWCFEIETRGISRHQVHIDEGINAITGMTQIINQLDRDALTYTPDPCHPELPSIVVGTVQGGEKCTSTAERCVAQGDIRYLPSMNADQMKSDLKRAADDAVASMPGLDVTVRSLRGQWPYEASPEEEIVKALASSHEKLRASKPRFNRGLPMSAAITDAADMVRHGIPTVLYGPADWRTEANEGIAIDDLLLASQVYALTCHNVVSRPRDGREDER